MRPWRTLDRIETPQGALELRQRGERDFLITIAGRVLMTSAAHRSEDALAELGCPADRPSPRVLLGGLGMGFTLRAALARLPRRAEVLVVDLNPAVVAWCRGPLGPLTARAAEDGRVTIEIADVSRVIAEAPPGRFDSILLDLYEGPHHANNPTRDPLYGADALARTWRALGPGGVFAVWSEEPDRPFERRLVAAGFRVGVHRRSGGRAHIIYVAEREEAQRGQNLP